MEREKEREREEKKGQLKFYNTFQGRSRLKAGANCKTAKLLKTTSTLTIVERGSRKHKCPWKQFPETSFQNLGFENWFLGTSNKDSQRLSSC